MRNAILTLGLLGALLFWPSELLGQQKSAPRTVAAIGGNHLTAPSEAESRRWSQASPQLRTSDYAPSKFALPISGKQKQTKVAEIYEVWRLRSSVIRQTASKGERDRYYSALIQDVNTRLGAITFLEQTLNSPDATNDERTRYTGLVAHRERWLLVRERYATRLKQAYSPLPSDHRGKHPWPRYWCDVSSRGYVLCLNEDVLPGTYVGGHWTKDGGTWITDRYAPDIAFQVIHSLNSLMERADPNGLRSTTVTCSNGGIYAVTSGTRTSSMGIGRETETLPSPDDMQGMRAGCRAFGGGALAGGVGPGGPGGRGRSQMTQETISQMDSQIGACSESLTGGVAAGPLSTVLGMLGIPATVPELGLLALGALFNMPSDSAMSYEMDQAKAAAAEAIKNAETVAKDAENEAAGAIREAEFARTVAEEATRDAADAREEAKEAAKAADEAIAAAMADPDNEAKADASAQAAKDARDASARAQQAQAAADKAQRDAEEKAAKAQQAEDRAKAKRDQADATEQAFNAGSGASLGDPDLSGPGGCSSLKDWWQRFKAECDRSQGWDRPGTDCNDMVRRANGCVDVRLIYPNPEGDATCQRSGFDDFNSCAEREKAMGGTISSVEPGDITCAQAGPGTANTLQQEAAAWRARMMNPCTNPAARPTEGQCSRKVEIPGERAPDPIPIPTDTYLTPGLEVFDGLHLRGIGFGGPPPGQRPQ